MKGMKWIGAAVLLLLGAGLAVIGQPTIEDRMRRQADRIEKALSSREPFLDPGEVLAVKHNRDVRAVILDVRSEADFNRFHLIDAKRVPVRGAESRLRAELDPKWIKIVVGNDEAAAVEAWKRLTAAGMKNVYVLAGGVNLWLTIFRDGNLQASVPDAPGDDRLRHPFPAAVGSRDPAANPEPHAAEGREYEKRVKQVRAAGAPAGGCG
jgi:rhodanese-related sulfurtransferase